MGTRSSERIIQDVDIVLKSLEIVYRANGAEVERLDDRNGHRRKIVDEGKSVSWGGAWSRLVLDGEGIDKEESNMRFSLSTPK